MRAVSSTHAPLPAPLVEPSKHPLTWLRQRVELLGLRAIVTYVGICAVAALYYLLLETRVRLPFLDETNTDAWHHAVPDATLRHDIRNVGEGLLGGILAISFTYNHYRRIGKPNAVDRLETRLRIPNVKSGRKLTWWQIVLGIALIPVYAAVGFLIGEWLVAVLHPTVSSLAEHQIGGVLTNIKNNVIEQWPKKLIGFTSAFFFGHRPALAVIDDIQLWFAERRVATGKPLRAYHTPPFKARYNELAATGVVQARARRGLALPVTLAVLGVAIMGLGGYGYYVLNYIAKKGTTHATPPTPPVNQRPSSAR
jgi:hypothetical protein